MQKFKQFWNNNKGSIIFVLFIILSYIVSSYTHDDLIHSIFGYGVLTNIITTVLIVGSCIMGLGIIFMIVMAIKNSINDYRNK